MDIVVAVGRDSDNNLRDLYTGYDFSAGKAALAQATRTSDTYSKATLPLPRWLHCAYPPIPSGTPIRSSSRDQRYFHARRVERPPRPDSQSVET
jgi:hypothetical protein